MCGYEGVCMVGWGLCLGICSLWTELLYFSALYICPPSLSLSFPLPALEAEAAAAEGMYEALLSCLGDE